MLCVQKSCADKIGYVVHLNIFFASKAYHDWYIKNAPKGSLAYSVELSGVIMKASGVAGADKQQVYTEFLIKNDPDGSLAKELGYDIYQHREISFQAEKERVQGNLVVCEECIRMFN